MAKKSDIHLVVITPERSVADEKVDSVTIPAHDGEIGIWSDRAPLMCELGVGQLRYQQGGKQQRMFIEGGFAQVLDNEVTVLTTAAFTATELTPDVIAKADAAVKATGEGLTPERSKAARRAGEMRRLYEAIHDTRIPIPT